MATRECRDRARTQVFLLPDLGEGLTEAEIVRWRVAVGDVVAVDQVVVEVETAKAIVDVPCPYAGRVATPARRGRGRPLDVGEPLITVADAAAPARAGAGRPTPRPTARRSRPAPATC